MRRLLATFLILLFGFPLVTPLFGLSPEAGSNLPACCRRNGMHHCESLADASARDGVVVASARRCNEPFPQAVSPLQHRTLAFNAASLSFAELFSRPAIRPQMEAAARIDLDRSRRKRGPPSQGLSSFV